MTSTLLRDLDKRIAGHVLNTCNDRLSVSSPGNESNSTFVCLVHELEELVHNRLQEFPMGLQEPRVLANDIHDVGSHHSLVVLSTLDLTESKQVFDHCHQESLPRLLI